MVAIVRPSGANANVWMAMSPAPGPDWPASGRSAAPTSAARARPRLPGRADRSDCGYTTATGKPRSGIASAPPRRPGGSGRSRSRPGTGAIPSIMVGHVADKDPPASPWDGPPRRNPARWETVVGVNPLEKWVARSSERPEPAGLSTPSDPRSGGRRPASLIARMGAVCPSPESRATRPSTWSKTAVLGATGFPKDLEAERTSRATRRGRGR